MVGKSILDGIEIKDKAFPFRDSGPAPEAQDLVAIGVCVHCGSPAYGPKTIRPDADPASVPVVRTCDCQNSCKIGQTATK